MEIRSGKFNLNSAKSFVGKAVNLHMKDDSVIVNVKVKWVRKTISGNVLVCASRNGREAIPLRGISWAEPVQILEDIM